MDDECAFTYPSVAAWRAVAVAVTDPDFPIPKSSGIFSIIFAILGVVMVLIRHYVWVGKLEWMKKWHPNMMCISLAFVIPQTVCRFSQAPFGVRKVRTSLIQLQTERL